MSKITTADISNLDRQIEQLYKCKPLSEAEVKALCEKVTSTFSDIFMLGQRSSHTRVQCPACQSPSYNLWWHPRPVLRLTGTI